MKFRSFLIGMLVLSLLLPTYVALGTPGGHGGGGGGSGGEGGGDGGGSDSLVNTDLLLPPPGFTPTDTDYVLQQPESNLTSVDRTPIVEYVPLPEEVDDVFEALGTVAVIGGSIYIGYAVGGYVIWVQAAAAGAYSGTTHYIQNRNSTDPNTPSTARVTVTAVAVGLTGLPPVPAEIANQIINKIPAPTPPPFSVPAGIHTYSH